MACGNCKTGNNGVPSGCGDKGHCTSGSCNKLNTFDWLTTLEIDDPNSYKFAEVSFKNGARKTFYKVGQNPRYVTGDLVILDAGNGGYDIGRVSLMGDLVKVQMKKKNYTEDRITFEIIRKANQRDIDKMMEGRKLEMPALVKARVISRTLGLDMKIGDVEYQADLKKATFFYTSDGWVDFRELVKQYAKEFRVKIEMRQIGARQESARIGGIGACGRELCCSTWLTDFKSVNTTAARYQNIAINQSKLSGQCGRLKCCLNYELDLYIDELEKYPSNVEVLKAKNGRATLVKIDIFKGVLYYQYEPEKGRNIVMPLSPEEVKRIKSMNERGEYPENIIATPDAAAIEKSTQDDYSDVTGAVELPNDKKRKKKKKNSGNRQNPENKNVQNQQKSETQGSEPRNIPLQRVDKKVEKQIQNPPKRVLEQKVSNNKSDVQPPATNKELTRPQPRNPNQQKTNQSKPHEKAIIETSDQGNLSKSEEANTNVNRPILKRNPVVNLDSQMPKDNGENIQKNPLIRNLKPKADQQTTPIEPAQNKLETMPIEPIEKNIPSQEIEQNQQVGERQNKQHRMMRKNKNKNKN